MADYVIVGAGSAGCVLAARLSEDPATQVILIEAGGPDDAPDIQVPLAWPLIRKNQYDWDYTSEPEPGLDGRYVYLPRGKTLGGSSAINAMIYIRGHRAVSCRSSIPRNINSSVTGAKTQARNSKSNRIHPPSLISNSIGCVA